MTLDLQLVSLRKRLEAKQIGVKLTEKAKDYIIDSAYDSVYGARTLKHSCGYTGIKIGSLFTGADFSRIRLSIWLTQNRFVT